MCIRDSKYSPDLSPLDFHFFSTLKELLEGRPMADNGELKQTVTTWLNRQAVDFFDDSIINKIVPRLNKCLDLKGKLCRKIGVTL